MPEQKETERRLEQIRTALDQSTIIAITDLKGKITYVNDNFLKISGYSRKELIGATHSIVNSSHHDGEFWKKLWKTIARGETWNGIIRNQKKSGEFYWVETAIIPMRDIEGKLAEYIAIRKDVTDRVLAEQQLKRQREKTINSEKMATLGEMAAGIAHELGNPLGALRGRIEMLDQALKDSGKNKESIEAFPERALKIIDRMSTIIRGLQAYSRDASADPYTETPLGQLVEEVVEFVSHKFRKNNISLKKQKLPEDIVVECRGAEVGQVILNLISNACDATLSLEEKWVEISMADLGEAVEVTVTDSGKGIPETVAKSIFDPFFTTKDVGHGTGLGLSISRKIAESHGGKLELLKGPNTTFQLTLPKKAKLT